MSFSDVSVMSRSRSCAPVAAGKLLAWGEVLQLLMVVAICIACVTNAIWANQSVAWGAFFPAFAASAGLVLIGVYIRATRQMPRLALGAIGFGVFTLFTGSIAIFIFTLFPVVNPLIDPILIGIDAWLGYSWPRFVEHIAAYPTFGLALRYVYLGALPQVVAMIVLLSFLGTANALHRFLAVGILCMIVTVAVWWLFPSVGPAAYNMVSAEIQNQIGLVVNASYGADLRRLASVGLPVITPAQINGVIAFPSFHMIMACMVVWFARGTVAFVPMLLFNIAMVPATLSHGGHHLVDVLAGVVTFCGCLAVVYRLIPNPKSV